MGEANHVATINARLEHLEHLLTSIVEQVVPLLAGERARVACVMEQDRERAAREAAEHADRLKEAEHRRMIEHGDQVLKRLTNELLVASIEQLEREREERDRGF